MRNTSVEMIGRWIVCLIATVLVFPLIVTGEDVTRITLTDKVVMADLLRFGINMDGGNGSFPIRVQGDYLLWKKSVEEGFESGLWRWFQGAVQPSSGAEVKVSNVQPEWLNGAQWVIVSGKSRWKTGKVVKGIATEGGDGLVVLDQPVEMAAGDQLLFENLRPGIGGFDKQIKAGTHCSVITHRQRAGAVGTCVASLNATQDDQTLSFPLFITTFYGKDEYTFEGRGDWTIHFWAKANNGQPSLVVDAGDYGNHREVPLDNQWKEYRETIHIERLKPANKELDEVARRFGNRVRVDFRASGGEVLLDDVAIWQEGHQNPTAYRDEVIAVLQRLQPGILRWMQGSGAITRDEMEHFMEYLGAPPEVGWGQLRAELGHPKPWLETLHGVNIEFGNEIPNFGGFGGPDYWHDLIEAGKKSRYYSSKVFFTMGRLSQALDYAKNMDSLSVAGYTLWGFAKEHPSLFMKTDQDTLRWAMGYCLDQLWTSTPKEYYEKTKQIGVSMTMYEGNFHTSFGDGPEAPRNGIVASVGGAVGYINRMLYQIRDYHVRKQCFFQFGQRFMHSSQPSNFGHPAAGFVKIFAAVLSPADGHERFRPSFHTLEMCNRLLHGNLVETKHSGANPTFDATGIWGRRNRDFDKAPVLTKTGFPCLFSYGFADRKERGLILINLDVERTLPVQLDFAGGVASGSATVVTLAGEKITDQNDLDVPEAKIKPLEKKRNGFATGTILPLPPCSLTTVAWRTAEPETEKPTR